MTQETREGEAQEAELNSLRDEIAKVIRWWQVKTNPDGTAQAIGNEKKFSRESISEWINILAFLKEVKAKIAGEISEEGLNQLADKSQAVTEELASAKQRAKKEDQVSGNLLALISNKFTTFQSTLANWKNRNPDFPFLTVLGYLREDIAEFEKFFNIPQSSGEGK